MECKPNFQIMVSGYPGQFAWFVTPCLRLVQKHFGFAPTEPAAREAAENYALAAYGRSK